MYNWLASLYTGITPRVFKEEISVSWLRILPAYLSSLWKTGYIGHHEVMMLKVAARMNGFKGFDKSRGIPLEKMNWGDDGLWMEDLTKHYKKE